MGFPGSLTVFTISVAIAAYLYYGLVNVPVDMDSRDDVMWMYAKRKYTRALSIVGEYLGYGNRVVLSRSVSQFLSFPSPANITGVKVYDTEFSGVRVRIYDPQTRVSNGPAMLWIHGGGWVTRTVESDDGLMAEIARRLDILVVSIDYRLAPEHPFPAGFDDCVTATVHLFEHVSQFNVNKDRIAIAGASAGGNLAAAVALKLRDDKELSRHRLQHQVLVVPCLQAFDFYTPSYQMNGDNAFLPTDWMVHYWMLYGFGLEGDSKLVGYAKSNDHTSREAKGSLTKLVDHNLLHQKHIPVSFTPDSKNHGEEAVWNKVKDVILNPYFAPLMEKNLKHLPEAYIVTSEYDVLRDDGLMYAKRLSQAGNRVTVKNYERSFHAVIDSFQTIDISKKCMNELVAHLAVKL